MASADLSLLCSPPFDPAPLGQAPLGQAPIEVDPAGTAAGTAGALGTRKRPMRGSSQNDSARATAKRAAKACSGLS